MKLVVSPGARLTGATGQGSGNPLPGDKSLSHRAALFAALAEGESVIDNFLVSGVTDAMLNALTDLNVAWELKGSRLLVQGGGFAGMRASQSAIYCGNSATTLRLLAGALAAAGIPAILDGSPGLRSRPMMRIVEPLKMMGVPVEASGEGTAPLALASRPFDQPLKALRYAMPQASAQVKSCLLLAALAGDGPTTIIEPAPTRDHTERMLSAMGVQVVKQTYAAITLVPPQPLRLHPLTLELPGDFSAAAFLIVAALIAPGSQVLLTGVGLNSGRTGLLEALWSMGADIELASRTERGNEPVGDILVRSSNLHGTRIQGELVARMIDEFPAFSVAAAYADGATQVCDAEELRYKESDRIAALCQELRKVGIAADETPDGFTISGGGVLGGCVDSHRDHRIAMALAVAGLAAKSPVEVEGAEIIHESFPNFTGVLRSLGAEIH
ncbi:MAG: 3-phosphoshikimate 1-carboxyvinyltransferase [Omnitrophica WOR_2 bacterium]